MDAWGSMRRVPVRRLAARPQAVRLKLATLSFSIAGRPMAVRGRRDGE